MFGWVSSLGVVATTLINVNVYFPKSKQNLKLTFQSESSGRVLRSCRDNTTIPTVSLSLENVVKGVPKVWLLR